MTIDEAQEFGSVTFGIDMNTDIFRKRITGIMEMGRKLSMGDEFIYMAYLKAVKRDGIMRSQVIAWSLEDILSSFYRAYMKIRHSVRCEEQLERFLSWCKMLIYTAYIDDNRRRELLEHVITDGENIFIEIYGDNYEGVGIEFLLGEVHYVR